MKSLPILKPVPKMFAQKLKKFLKSFMERSTFLSNVIPLNKPLLQHLLSWVLVQNVGLTICDTFQKKFEIFF